MKKTLLPFCLLLMLNLHSAAQKKWGIAASMGLNRISGYKKINIETGPLITLQGFVFADLPLNKEADLVLIPSLGYYPKGVKFTGITFTDTTGNNTGAGNVNLRIDYLQLSLPVSFKTDWSKKVTGCIGLGPYVAYALSAQQKNNITTGNTGTTTTKLDFKKASLNRFDAGIVIQFNAVIEKRWYAGLSTEIGMAKVNSAGAITNRNQASHLFVGYTF